jgi:DNA repair protein RadC
MKKLQKFKLKDLPIMDKPYEKLEAYGAETLSDSELLAIIIKTGVKEYTAIDVARSLIKKGGDIGFRFLHDMTLDEMKEIKGIGRVKAIQLKALAEISIRLCSSSLNNKNMISNDQDVSDLLMEEMRYLKREIFKVIMLNNRLQVMGIVNVSVGGSSNSTLYPKEVFCDPIKKGCNAIILVHNHPSGDPEPSGDDIRTTSRLIKAGELLGIEILDHIIIGDGIFVSMKSKGILEI